MKVRRISGAVWLLLGIQFPVCLAALHLGGRWCGFAALLAANVVRIFWLEPRARERA